VFNQHNDAFDNPKSDDADDEQKISASTAAATSAVINIDDDSVNKKNGNQKIRNTLLM